MDLTARRIYEEQRPLPLELEDQTDVLLEVWPFAFSWWVEDLLNEYGAVVESVATPASLGELLCLAVAVDDKTSQKGPGG